MYSLLRPLLFRLDPERSHDLALGWLARIGASRPLCAATRKLLGARVPGLASTVMGIRFPNPIGLAAGLDKQGNCANAFDAIGFGWVELGTVTPMPQPGNTGPRMFRLQAEQAIINRMGFNSIGLDAFLANVVKARPGIIKGINIGKNAATPVERAADDYLACLDAVYRHADYITINISSPNTRNLRDLQEDEALDQLLHAITEAAARLADRHGNRVPLVLKIAPDLEPVQITHIAALLRKHGIDGVAATNTTLSRVGVESSRYQEEAGGLSGSPLREKSTAVIRVLRTELGGEIPIIGIGGILDPVHAIDKFAAGADLVQLYTGLIYRGPSLVREIAKELQRKAGDRSFPQLLDTLRKT